LIGGDLKCHLGSFGTENFQAPRNALSELFRPPADIAAENFRNCVRLNVVGPIVDNNAGTNACIVVPKVSVKTSYLYNTEIIEFDASKMTFPDVIEKNVFAKIIVWGLTERAGTGDSATAVVEPITGDAPIRGI
jgi:hypothetical protein